MNRVYIFIVLIFSQLAVFAELQESSSPFEEANAFYTAKEYTKAIDVYEQILLNEGAAPALYYNLGNAYFRINELGKSILNYERALRLNPSYKDAKFNLEFANQGIVDRIELADTFFLKKWVIALNSAFHTNVWFYISAALFISCLIFILLFVFGKTKILRKISFYLALALLILCVVTLNFSFTQKSSMKNHTEGIVMTGSIVIKGSPDKSGTDLFQLHEGTKVMVLSSLGDWYEIKLPNGNIGWVEIIHIEKI